MADSERKPNQPDPQSLTAMLELAALIESKDAYTAGHTWRVANYARMLAERLGYDRDYLEQISVAGTLHDLGKILIPIQVLNTRERLSDSEFKLIRRHPLDGFDLLKYEPMFTGVLDVVLHHHEAFDGSGYPVGLAGEHIPETARLFAVVDAFDAMTSTRPYSLGMSVERAVEIIEQARGSQFDASIVNHFVELCRNGDIGEILGHSGPGYALGECAQCGPIIDIQTHHRPGEEVTCRGCGGVYRIVEMEAGVTRLEFTSRIDAESTVDDTGHLPGNDGSAAKGNFWRCLDCGQVGLSEGELPDGCPECHTRDALVTLKS